MDFINLFLSSTRTFIRGGNSFEEVINLKHLCVYDINVKPLYVYDRKKFRRRTCIILGGINRGVVGRELVATVFPHLFRVLL